MSERTSILIILMGSLGDVTRGLTVADSIKAEDPNTHITWLIEPKCKELAELSSSLDEVLVFERGRLFSLFRIVWNLLSRKFDVTLDMQRHSKSGFFSLLSRAKRRIGFHRRNSKEFNWIFQTETIAEEVKEENKFTFYQRFASQLGFKPPVGPKILLKPVQSISSKRYVFLVMGSSWSSKNWVEEGYSRVMGLLRKEEYEIVLVGGKADNLLAEEVLKMAGSEGVRNMCGKTNLAELIALIKGATVGIGPDSGPGHLAAAVGVPYISLFGPTSPLRVAPIGYEHLVVTASVGCSPCYKKVCPGLNKICMRLISVPGIIEKVRLAVGDS